MNEEFWLWLALSVAGTAAWTFYRLWRLERKLSRELRKDRAFWRLQFDREYASAQRYLRMLNESDGVNETDRPDAAKNASNYEN